jgi:predicted Rossmann fold flavoprotein
VKKNLRIAVIGGGAAGFFGALRAKSLNPQAEVEIFESAAQPLGKVRISGGGRCNVTNSCFDVSKLVKSYPRGQRELPGILTRFGPRETARWFEAHGVPLKTEPDGRMFPTTDRSQSVVDCLVQNAARSGVELHVKHPIGSLIRRAGGFLLDQSYQCDRVLLASGSSKKGCEWLSALGHHLVEPVPSLFTFNVRDSRLSGLEGVSVALASCTLEPRPGLRIASEGPLLVTHWGLSGPAVLRLSAWGARELHACNYRCDLRVDWLPALQQEALRLLLLDCKERLGRRKVGAEVPPGVELSRRLWKQLAESEVGVERCWNETSNRALNKLSESLKRMVFKIEGKGVFKEEFVTAGGVPLTEVDLTTMQSRICPGLYLAGEVLDIDGITGGFNFQSAWSTAWLAGSNIGT